MTINSSSTRKEVDIHISIAPEGVDEMEYGVLTFTGIVGLSFAHVQSKEEFPFNTLEHALFLLGRAGWQSGGAFGNHLIFFRKVVTRE